MPLSRWEIPSQMKIWRFWRHHDTRLSLYIYIIIIIISSSSSSINIYIYITYTMKLLVKWWHPAVFLLMGRDIPNSASHFSPDLVSCDPASLKNVVSNEIHDNPWHNLLQNAKHIWNAMLFLLFYCATFNGTSPKSCHAFVVVLTRHCSHSLNTNPRRKNSALSILLSVFVQFGSFSNERLQQLQPFWSKNGVSPVKARPISRTAILGCLTLICLP